jgi:MoaA/NifB/PqqE/SkfB family radical SAM enzyme
LIENCCLKYRCPAARNFALARWEIPLPTSRACNSRCLGCISFQSTKKLCSPQQRISFTPTADEIAEIVIPHFENAELPVASFGQGCEGEPLTEWEIIEEAIKIIRYETKKGIINLNTNASFPDRIERLLDAGLDSIRVSMNSAREEFYEKYFNPTNYKFEDVIESIKIARKKNKFVSLNYFVFPGFTDQVEEWKALEKMLAFPGVNMIQWRNLNIDPDWYIDEMEIDLSVERIGIKQLIENVRKNFSGVRFGYFNPYF